MSAAFKTISEQRLEWLESLERPLSDAESDELRRAMHAVYEHNRRANALKIHDDEEKALLRRLEREAEMPSDLS